MELKLTGIALNRPKNHIAGKTYTREIKWMMSLLCEFGSPEKVFTNLALFSIEGRWYIHPFYKNLFYKDVQAEINQN